MTATTLLLPSHQTIGAFTDAFLRAMIEDRKAVAYDLCDQVLVAEDDALAQALLVRLNTCVDDIRLARQLLAVGGAANCPSW
jgi:hypothetical protein